MSDRSPVEAAGGLRGPGAIRLVELALCLLTLPIWGALVAALALLVRLVDGAPAFFRQERAGLGGRPFTLVKLRTMRTGEGSDAVRLTQLGRVLRRTSLDELPQLWQVVTGTLALVGPRPLPVRYLPRYSPEQMRRHAVRPGLTGWAQVNGRNGLSWAERFRLDVWYVDHRSLGLDVRIMWMTVGRVLAGRGVSADDDATMREFQG
jgi:lipopolysaccharide/colanic/teichoic acid biosynthesis glycosyltransferase